MFMQVHDKQTRKLIGFVHVCNGCGDKSPVRKVRKLPPRWVEKTELSYGPTGQRRKGMGFSVNYYCSVCNSYGVTAHTVAATTRKLCQTKLIRETLNPTLKEKACPKPSRKSACSDPTANSCT